MAERTGITVCESINVPGTSGRWSQTYGVACLLLYRLGVADIRRRMLDWLWLSGFFDDLIASGCIQALIPTWPDLSCSAGEKHIIRCLNHNVRFTYPWL